MSKMFKDFPTDEDYTDEYWNDFIKNQTEFRNRIMSSTRKAGDKNELVKLGNQIMLLGTQQAQIKSWLLMNVFGRSMIIVPSKIIVPWDGKTEEWLRKDIMEKDSPVPKWQRREMLYTIDMYHDMLAEMDEIYKKREAGL